MRFTIATFLLIPIAEVVKQELGADMVFFARSQANCNAHAPNEWFRVEDFRRGTAAMCAFLERVGSRSSKEGTGLVGG